MRLICGGSGSGDSCFQSGLCLVVGSLRPLDEHGCRGEIVDDMLHKFIETRRDETVCFTLTSL